MRCIGLMKLHSRHLDILRSLIPSMRAYLEEKLRDTQHSIRHVTDDLMAAEACITSGKKSWAR